MVRENVDQKLRGKYGCKRFLRDGYQTVKEVSENQKGSIIYSETC